MTDPPADRCATHAGPYCIVSSAEAIRAWPKNEFGWHVCPVHETCAQIGHGAQIGNYARIGNGARIGNDARIGNGARIGNDAQIGNYAQIGNDEEWEGSPLHIIGSAHPLNACGTRHDSLAIGCEVHEISHWLTHYKSIGEANGYTPDEIEEYGRYIRLAAEMYAKDTEEPTE